MALLVRSPRLVTVISIFLAVAVGCWFLIALVTFTPSPSLESQPPKERAEEKRIEPFLFIMILSSPDSSGLERRTVMRETWLSLIPRAFQLFGKTVEYRFLLGQSVDAQNSAYFSPDILKEQAVYGDLALVEHREAYGSLTGKVLAGFLWTQRLYPRIKFLLKCDDDTFVHIPKMVEALLPYPPKSRLYWGYFDGRAPVFKSGKWAEKQWIASDRYMPYALGGGYVMAGELVHYICSNSELLSVFGSEDVSVGLWLAPLNLTRHHDKRFDTEWVSRGCSNKFIVTHKQSLQDFRSKHKMLVATDYQDICEKEFIVRGEYDYNWSVLPTACCPGRPN